ncbi:MAG: chromosomal replication initiator protein DnaA [Anaerolineae bacterium]|nr:chromosomal replication initiator protein DnaA [Anaerolineae bacterium]
MNPNQIWQAALGELQLQMTRATFETWVKQTSVIGFEDGVFIIGVQSNFAKEWLENRLLGLIKRTLTNLMGRSVEVRFAVHPKSYELSEQEAGPLLTDTLWTPAAYARSSAEAQLNEKYTFETFVVGPNNRLAHAAARSVAERPAAAYNPLFLYGGVGLGKTHLLHAIGHYALQHGRSVRYVSSEQFTNELINAIRNQTTVQFREKYRSIDVLLIDDIQFIAGKESTQEEFFHTFNALHAANRQIVITSDRPPKAINALEERLRSRFEGGLMADISPPDFETRLAILRNKADTHNITVPDAVLEFIARKVQSNIRELEGSLNRVIIYANMMGAPLTVDLAAQALQDIVLRAQNLDPEAVLRAVAGYYHLRVEDLLGKKRSKEIAFARQMAMYLLRSELELSLPQIGERLGGRDHTTVLYACEKLGRLIEEDAGVRRDYLNLREALNQPAQGSHSIPHAVDKALKTVDK